jgi:hypothetical protein
VNVGASSDLSSELVSALLEEAAAIWRPAGVTLVWRQDGSHEAPGLHVLIGDDQRYGSDGALPLGWISFDGGTPRPEIFVSYANALRLLMKSSGVVGSVAAMPNGQRVIYLARAMGRALAHEIGHYLLASKLHSEKGIMRARQTAAQLFGPARQPYTIDRWMLEQLAARFAGGPRLAGAVAPRTGDETSSGAHTTR